MKKFAREKLAQHDGKNGNPTYVAYKGKVYGVSRAYFGNCLSSRAHLNSAKYGEILEVLKE